MPAMPSFLTILVLSFGFFVLFAPMCAARAETPIEVYQIQCMAELDVLEIRLLDLADETKRQLVARGDKAYAKSRGLFVPALYSHLDLAPNDPRYGIEAERFECDMLSGHAVLTAVPEPVEGHAISAAVTITRDKYLLVDDVPFRHCAGGAPLTGLTYAESSITNRILLAGRFNGREYNGKELERLETVYRLRWEIEPVLRPHNVGYEGIDYAAQEWRSFESCRYQGPGSPLSRLKSMKTDFKISSPPPPRGDGEILATTRPVSRSYDKRWAAWKLYQISCLPDLDFFEVRKLDFGGDDVSRRTKSQKKTPPDQLYNLYVPDWHETAYIDRLRNLSTDPRLAESIIDIPPTVFACQLSAGLTRLSIWSTWLGAAGMDIMITLRLNDRLLANLVQFERCGFMGRLSFRAADHSFTLGGYPPNDRFILVDDERGDLIDDTIGALSYGKRFAVFGEDPERVALNQFYSCRYTGPSS